MLSAAAVFSSFVPEAGEVAEEKPEMKASYRSAAAELASEVQAPAPMESHSGNESHSLEGGMEDEHDEPGELPAGNPPADNAGAGSPSELLTLSLDPDDDTPRILSNDNDDEKENTEDSAADDEVGGWDVFVSWLTGMLPGGAARGGLATGAQGVTNVTKYIDRLNASLAEQTGDDSYDQGNSGSDNSGSDNSGSDNSGSDNSGSGGSSGSGRSSGSGSGRSGNNRNGS